MLKITLLASAIALALYGTAQAATPSIDATDLIVKIQSTHLMQLADSGKGSSGSGGGDSDSNDSDSDDNDSDDNDSDDNDDNDDNGGSVGGGGSNDDDSSTGSGRKKKRIPGGSGCDDAGDIAEHPECSPN